MNSADLQQNFILFLENKTKKPQKNQSRRLCCEKCRFSTKDIDLFERHVAHHKEVTFACNLCNHISYSRVESQRHIVLHKGSFPYKCNWCSYGAVRRDYMVKHMQRIHGRSADGNLTADCALASPIMEHLPQHKTTLLHPDTARALDGHLKNINSSTGKVFSLVPSVKKSNVSTPYVAKPVHQMTNNQPQLSSTPAQSAASTACFSAVPIAQLSGVLPHSEPSFSNAANRVTLGVSSSQNAITGISQTVGRLPGKPSMQLTHSLGVLPKVHVNVGADRTIQPKALQTSMGAMTDKTVIQSKTIPKVQVALPVGNYNHLKTLLSNPGEASGQKSLDIQNVPTTPVVHFPVAKVVKRTDLSGAHPSTPTEWFGQSPPVFTPSTLTTEKTVKQRTRPNILVKPPSEKLSSSFQPNVQVELLAPLNQPIQHNKPLTVACPQEITIPAGCLVELVEVKNVNGTRELELRLVPQQPDRPEPGNISRNTTGADPTSRLSFKCKLDPEDAQQKGQNQGKSKLQASGISGPRVKGPYINQHCTRNTVPVKDEPGTASLVGNSTLGSGSPKVSQPLFTGPLPCTGNFYQSANTKTITTEELRNSQATANKPDVVESKYEGFPVISSVFSLCSIPETPLVEDDDKGGILDGQVERTRTPLASGLNKMLKKSFNYKIDLKKEEETGSLTISVQKSADPVVPVVSGKSSDVVQNSLQTFSNNLKGNTRPEVSTPSSGPQQPEASDPASSKNEQPTSNKDCSQDHTVWQANDKTLSMNPKVALVRIPSLDFYSLLETAKNIPERIFGEESVTARPVLYCKTSQQNLQDRTIKLVLKRKRSECENMDSDQQPVTHFDVLPPHKKHKKDKKRAKKQRSELEAPDGKVEKVKLWLTPLKEEQPVKLPGPNQPVVVLNHPKPKTVHVENVAVESPEEDKSIDPAQVLNGQQGAGPSFKIKLKKVQGQEYQVTELVLKGFSGKMVL